MLCGLAGGEPDDQGGGTGPDPGARHREAAEGSVHLPPPHQPDVMAPADVQQPAQRAVEHVIADEQPAGAEHPDSLGQGLLPGHDMVQHRRGEHEIEPVVAEREVRRVGALHADPVPERRERLFRRPEQAVVVVRGGHAQLRIGGQELRRHGPAAGADFQALPGRVLALQHPRQDDTPCDEPVRAAREERPGCGGHLGHALSLPSLAGAVHGGLAARRPLPQRGSPTIPASPPRSRMPAAPRMTHRTGSSTTSAPMSAADSILLARPGSSAPPPVRRIFSRNTSPARPGGRSDKISCTQPAMVATVCSSAAATSVPGTRSARGIRRTTSMPTASAHPDEPPVSPSVTFSDWAALRPMLRPSSVRTAWVIASSIALPASRSDWARATRPPAITATSVVPPPISTMNAPDPPESSTPAPAAAATGSSRRRTR